MTRWARARHVSPTPRPDTTHSAQPTGSYYPQAWFLLLSVLAFATYVAWDRGVFTLILALDRSYMASITMALFVVASAHCGWHIVHCAQRIRHIQHWLAQPPSRPHTALSHPDAFVNEFLCDLQAGHPSEQASSDDAVVDIHAERVRGPVDLGWFFVDLAVRLGLLGTIIGFILIFASLSDLDISGGDDLKNLLIAMSGGMGTALLTTLTGLVGASVLSFQYLILGRESEHLIGLMMRVSRRSTHIDNATA